MATNILALPMIQITVQTANNEDWIDTIKFLVGPDPGTAQLDLRGIDFEMEVRRAPDDHEVVLSASTQNGKLAIGVPPDFGYLLINIPLSEMKMQWPGEYVGDCRASSGGFTRRCIDMTMTIVEGVTK